MNKGNGNYHAEKNYHTLDNGRGLGSSGSEGEIIGDVQIGIDYSSSEGGFDSRENFNQLDPKGDIGKILSQLREIERSHLAYVGGHKKRLESRLNEAEEHERKFVSQVEAVEQQIQNLMDSLEQ